METFCVEPIRVENASSSDIRGLKARRSCSGYAQYLSVRYGNYSTFVRKTPGAGWSICPMLAVVGSKRFL